MDTFEILQKEAPEVACAFYGMVEALKDMSGLDAKTKQLVYIGIKSSLGDAVAIFYHIAMAKELGATREEIRDTILVTLSVCGLKGVSSCLGTALRIYDQHPNVI